MNHLANKERATLQSWQRRQAWKTLTATALAVVAFASPAAAATVDSSTTVQASPSTATTGQSVDLNAAVTCTGDPSGGLGITFFDGADLLTTVPVGADGTATYSTSFTTTGAHTITAAYNGNGNCNASSDTTTVQVSAAPAPPTSLSGLCLIFCNGLFDLRVTNVGNVGNIYNIGSRTGFIDHKDAAIQLASWF